MLLRSLIHSHSSSVCREVLATQAISKRHCSFALLFESFTFSFFFDFCVHHSVTQLLEAGFHTVESGQPFNFAHTFVFSRFLTSSSFLLVLFQWHTHARRIWLPSRVFQKPKLIRFKPKPVASFLWASHLPPVIINIEWM